MKINLTKDRTEKPLRFMEPDCFQLLLNEMEKCHLQPYDLKADAVWQDDHLRIRLRFGEGLTQSKEDSFSRVAVENKGKDLSVFFSQAVEDCKKALIGDYFKMMKP